MGGLTEQGGVTLEEVAAKVQQVVDAMALATPSTVATAIDTRMRPLRFSVDFSGLTLVARTIWAWPIDRPMTVNGLFLYLSSLGGLTPSVTVALRKKTGGTTTTIKSHAFTPSVLTGDYDLTTPPTDLIVGDLMTLDIIGLSVAPLAGIMAGFVKTT